MKRNPGRPRKADALVTISGRVPPQLKTTITKMEQAEGATVSKIVCRLLEQGLAVDGVLARRASNAN